MIAVRIAGETAGVDCRVERLLPIVQAMLALYPPSRARPQLWFVLEPEGERVRLRVGEETLWIGEAFETAAALEVHWYLRLLARLRRRFVSLHAAWAVVDGRAIAIAGASGAGKSSLITAAGLAGAAYGSDEFALLNASGFLFPFARPLQWGRVRHPAFSHAAMRAAGCEKFRFCFRDHRGKRRLNLWWYPPSVRRRRAPLALLALAQYRAQAGVAIEPVPRSAALLELAAQMHTKGASVREDIRQLHRHLPKELAVVRLSFDDARRGWQALASYLRRISATIGR